MIKSELRTIVNRGLLYVVDGNGRPRRYESWMGGLTAPIYELGMARSVFPRLFAADQAQHRQILREALAEVHGRRILEIGAGSGSATAFLPADNDYVGIDVSPALLRRAAKAFSRAGFSEATFYVASGDDLPLADASVDVCLCILTLNFVPDPAVALAEARRVLAPGGYLLCAVPVPERKETKGTIHGTICSEADLAGLCAERGLRFEALPDTNGALLYFRAWR